MKTPTPWRTRRAALSSIVVGTLLLAGIASPAVASAPPSASAQQPPGPQAKRHLDPAASITAQALAITEPTRATPHSSRGTSAEGDPALLFGFVESANLTALAGVLVSVYSADWDGVTPYDYTLTPVQTVETDANGHWELSVPAGYYSVFFDPIDDPMSAWSWANGQAYLGAEPLVVGSAEGHEVSIDLPVAHAVGGTLTGGPTNTSLTGVSVTLWAGEQRTADQIWFVESSVLTGQSGRYDFTQVPDGEYLVEVKTPSTRYVGEWWNNKPDFETSDIIELHSGKVVANVNLAEYAQVLPALTVAGVPAVGNLVSVTVPTKVTGATYNYNWYADGVGIAGSAGKSSFTITSAQQGKQLSAKVTVSKTGYVTASRTTPRTTRVIAHSAPTITGSIAVGYTLTAHPNTWTTGTTFTYQWYANGVAITGAKAVTYKLALAQRDTNITVRVWGSKAGYTTVWRGSVATAKVAQVAKPTITGTAKVGQKLTAVTAGWTPSTTFKFQWYASGVAISGAVSRVLTLTTAQVGKTITVKAIGSKIGYITYSQTSLPTAKVVK